jgi:serine/threonine protein kinase
LFDFFTIGSWHNYECKTYLKQGRYMANRVGVQLGNYRLTRFLGEGGFAEVYLGEHIHLGTYAAIKLLHTQLRSSDVDTFRNEARTIARLVHPHIVRVLDFGVEDNIPFLVMDYAPNGTLRQRYPRGIRLPLSTATSYVKQVADALQYAHNEKLIHRDIKPENMLLGRNKEILLSDFGIATVAHRTTTQNTQTIAGTAVYMAPELFKGKSYASSDQYALGIVLYEWLTGEPPYSEGDFIQLGYQHSMVPLPSLRDKVPSLSPAVEQVITKVLAKDPKQRFPDIQAFATALEQANSQSSISRLQPHPGSTSYLPNTNTPQSTPTTPYAPPPPPSSYVQPGPSPHGRPIGPDPRGASPVRSNPQEKPPTNPYPYNQPVSSNPYATPHTNPYPYSQPVSYPSAQTPYYPPYPQPTYAPVTSRPPSQNYRGPKSAFIAGLFELFIPGAGFAYTFGCGIGILMFIVSTAVSTIATMALSSAFHTSSTTGSTSSAASGVFLVLLLIWKIASIVLVVVQTNKYNRKY